MPARRKKYLFMNAVAQKEERPARPEATCSHERSLVLPKVNIIETKDDVYPGGQNAWGGQRGTGGVSLEDNLLTITGRRQPDRPLTNLLHRESEPVDYRRAFELGPAHRDRRKINAQIEQGILTLTLLKAEKVKARRITVN